MSRTLAVLLLALAGCGGAPPRPAAPAPPVEGTPRERAEPDAGIAIEEPPPTPCVASPPSRESLLRLGHPGLVRVDATAPREIGACVSPALIARSAAIACEPSGTRCAIDGGEVLVAREIADACVPVAVVRGAGATALEAAEVAAAIAMRDEACAVHDRIARRDPALFETVDRARRIAAGAGGVLVGECLRDDVARALARETIERFARAPLICAGLRCESAAEIDAGPDVPPAGSLVFANRVSGPPRFDSVAWVAPADHPRALELLRERCR